MELDRDRCHERLHAHGVRFRALSPDEAPEVAQPVRLRGPVAGVTFTIPWSRDLDADHHAIWDCRLAVAMVPLAGWLAARGIHEVQYFSTLRRGEIVRRKPRSMHNVGLAIDVLGWRKGRDHTLWRVEDEFPTGTLRSCEESGRRPGRRSRRAGRGAPDAIFADFVCHVWRERLVHTLLTPDHDRAHHNHLHLDLKPGQDAPANPYVSLASGSAPEPP